MSEALRIKALTKNFGGLGVTRNVSIVLPVGARTALIGPNGAGKTTLVNLICGALQPTSGNVFLFGEDIGHESLAQRARKGLVRTFQVTRLFSSLTVEENVRLSAIQRRDMENRFWPTRSATADLDRDVDEALAMLGLADRGGRPIDELAYGEQRLVELAIALAAQPKVLLLDEPAAGVPQGESHVIMEAIASLPSDLAILFIEHDMDLVFRFAQEIAVLVAGEIILTGSPDMVAASEEVKRIYFGEAHA